MALLWFRCRVGCPQRSSRWKQHPWRWMDGRRERSAERRTLVVLKPQQETEETAAPTEKPFTLEEVWKTIFRTATCKD